MAEEKRLFSRIQQKHDIEANWKKAVNFIPKAGEMIVYDVDDNYNHERFKIGDGVTLVSDLPFASAGKTSLNNNEIFNDYENNIGVAKAFKLISIDEYDMGTSFDYDFELDSVDGLESGMVISYQSDKTFYNIGKIQYIVGNRVGGSGFPKLSNKLSTYGHDSIHGNFLWITDRPDLGTTDILSQYIHAEGTETEAHFYSAHAEGYKSKALGKYAHAEGRATEAYLGGHAEGHSSKAKGHYAHAEGLSSSAEGEYSHAEGQNTIASGNVAHAEGKGTKATGENSHAEGFKTTAQGNYSHAEGNGSIAAGDFSHAEGAGTIANGDSSHAMGQETIADGNAQMVVGRYNTPDVNALFVVGNGTHPEKRNNAFMVHDDGSATLERTGSNFTSVATKGYVDSTIISKRLGRPSENGGIAFNNALSADLGKYAFAEGNGTAAKGNYSHAEGASTVAEGTYSHAEGAGCIAKGLASHAAGQETIASGTAQTVVGKYNKENEDALFIVGNGTGAAAAKRTNAFEVKADGSAILQTMDYLNENAVVIKSYVDDEDNLLYNMIDTVSGRVNALTSSSLTREIVSVLPNFEDAKDNVIYMVPAEDLEMQNSYNEYMFIGEGYELIGNTKVDLSDYQQKFAEVNDTDDEVILSIDKKLTVHNELSDIILSTQDELYQGTDLQLKKNGEAALNAKKQISIYANRAENNLQLTPSGTTLTAEFTPLTLRAPASGVKVIGMMYDEMAREEDESSDIGPYRYTTKKYVDEAIDKIDLSGYQQKFANSTVSSWENTSYIYLAPLDAGLTTGLGFNFNGGISILAGGLSVSGGIRMNGGSIGEVTIPVDTDEYTVPNFGYLQTNYSPKFANVDISIWEGHSYITLAPLDTKLTTALGLHFNGGVSVYGGIYMNGGNICDVTVSEDADEYAVPNLGYLQANYSPKFADITSHDAAIELVTPSNKVLYFSGQSDFVIQGALNMVGGNIKNVTVPSNADEYTVPNLGYLQANYWGNGANINNLYLSHTLQGTSLENGVNAGIKVNGSAVTIGYLTSETGPNDYINYPTSVSVRTNTFTISTRTNSINIEGPGLQLNNTGSSYLYGDTVLRLGVNKQVAELPTALLILQNNQITVEKGILYNHAQAVADTGQLGVSDPLYEYATKKDIQDQINALKAELGWGTF